MLHLVLHLHVRMLLRKKKIVCIITSDNYTDYAMFAPVKYVAERYSFSFAYCFLLYFAPGERAASWLAMHR